MICRRVLLGVVMVGCIMTTGYAADKRVVTPSGYDDYWPGLAAGGRDSLHHRVIFAHRVDRADTIIVQYKDGRLQSIGVSYEHTIVELELTRFKRWLVVLEYPVRDENLFTTGWDVNVQGEPTKHLKARWSDIRSVTLRQHGIDTMLHPKLP